MRVFGREIEIANPLKLFMPGQAPVFGGTRIGFSGGSFSGFSQSPEAFVNQYGSVGWVYACVSKISSSVADNEWRLYQQGSNGEDRKEFESHPLLDLMAAPNPFQTWFDLIQTAQIWMDLAGEYFWLLVRAGPFSDVVQIWPIPPALMTIVPDANNFIAGYVFKLGEVVIPLEIEDIIHDKLPNPRNPYRGLSPVSAIMSDVDSEKFASQWNRLFFLNSATPEGVIEIENKLGREEHNRLLRQWETKHQGLSRSHQVAIISGGGKWKDANISQRDMEFESLRHVNRDVILGNYGVPLSILGISEDVNRANAEAAEYTFAKRVVKPDLGRFKRKFNQRLAPAFDRVEFDFDDPVPQNIELNGKIAKESWVVGLITRDEGREMIGFDPALDGGDEYRTPSLNAGPTPPNNGGPPSDEEPEEESPGGISPIIGPRRGFENVFGDRISPEILDELKAYVLEQARKDSIFQLPPPGPRPTELSWEGKGDPPDGTVGVRAVTDDDQVLWKAFVDEIEDVEKAFEEWFVDLSKRQFEDTMSNIERLEAEAEAEGRSVDHYHWEIEGEIRRPYQCNAPICSKQVNGDDAFDDAFWEETTGEESRGFYEDATFGAGDRFAFQFGFTFDRGDPDVERWLGKRIEQFSKGVTETTLKQVKAELVEANALGEGIPEIRKRMQKVFIDANDVARAERTRAQMVARTEMVSATNRGRYEAYVQVDVVIGKEWITAVDGRERPDHRAMHGTRTAKFEMFKVGQFGFNPDEMVAPGQGRNPAQNIQCRCTTKEILDDEEIKSIILMRNTVIAEVPCPDCGKPRIGRDLSGKASFWCKNCREEKPVSSMP